MITPFPTSSTAMAMALLRQHRARQIEDGKIIGEQLCRLYGTTHSRAITAEMSRRGLIHKHVPGFWIGVVLRDDRFVNTGFIVRPPLAPGAPSHDPRLISLWRLKQGGVVPLILYEFKEYCQQIPTPRLSQKIFFIFKHITFKKNTEGKWYGSTRWVDDGDLAILKRDLDPYEHWIRLFHNIRMIRETTESKAKAQAKTLITAFVNSVVR